MKVLFLGHLGGNSKYHYKNLKKKTKKIDYLDLDSFFRKNRVLGYLFNNITPLIFSPIIYLYFQLKITGYYDLIYVTSGEYLSRKTVKFLRKKCKKIFLYCPDNPFVNRDKKRWFLLKKSIHIYDHVIFIQPSRKKYTKKYNIKNYSIFYPHYEKSVHKKIRNVKKKYDIVFVGTWFQDRAKLIKKLIDKGLNIKVFGSRWNKDTDYLKYKNFFTVKNYSSREYSFIINSSRIALCLFSKENEDTITTRSTEIPAIGTFMITQRNNYHLKFLKNKEHTIYFNTSDQCIKYCDYFIKNPSMRERIAEKARIKITKKMRLTYEDFITKITKIYEN